jgi:hypothetical protein
VGGAVTLTVKDTVFRQDSLCINKKIIRRTYILADACGNDTIALQLITIRDTIPPGLNCPRDTTVTCFTDNPRQILLWFQPLIIVVDMYELHFSETLFPPLIHPPVLIKPDFIEYTADWIPVIMKEDVFS